MRVVAFPKGSLSLLLLLYTVDFSIQFYSQIHKSKHWLSWLEKTNNQPKKQPQISYGSSKAALLRSSHMGAILTAQQRNLVADVWNAFYRIRNNVKILVFIQVYESPLDLESHWLCFGLFWGFFFYEGEYFIPLKWMFCCRFAVCCAALSDAFCNICLCNTDLKLFLPFIEVSADGLGVDHPSLRCSSER